MEGRSGCRVAKDLQLEIKPLPLLEVPDTTYCNTPRSVSLPEPNLPGGFWSGAGIVDEAGLFDPQVAGGPGTYRPVYHYTADNGCAANFEVIVGVIDPANVDAGPDHSLCLGDEVYVLSDFANPAGGRWRSNAAGLTGDTFDPGEAGGGEYVLRYLVGSGNCRVEDQITITVIELNTVEAGPNQEVCVTSDPIRLLGSNPADEGRWEGDGVIDPVIGLFDPAVAGEGRHEVLFSIRDDETGCSNTDSKRVVVWPVPEADFDIPSPVCVGTDIFLESPDEEVSFIKWEVSDGRMFQVLSPSLSFDQGGAFTVDLSLENRFGCAASNQRAIEVLEPPRARFSLPEDEACVSLAVVPVDESTGEQLNYFWDFGNGNTGQDGQIREPVTYTADVEDRTYYVQLDVSNACGRDVHRDSVLIRALPIVDFGFTMDTACAPVNVAFNNVSQGNADEFFWDFGNGATSVDSLPAAQPYYHDTIPVDYVIMLTGSNVCGRDTALRILTVEPETVQAFFNISRVDGCAPLSVSLEDFSTPGTHISWDFGDGARSMEKHPIHTFTEAGRYRIRHFASNACAMDSSDIYVEVLPGPSVNFTFSSNLCVGQKVQFENSSNDGVNSMWHFGTGDSSNITHPEYEYAQPGTYPVRLQVSDAATGCRAAMEEEITISLPPAPAFALEKTEGCAPLDVPFTNLSSGADFYQWDFGDGNSSVAFEPKHTYLEAGRYDVKLTVSDKHGCTVDTVWTNVHAYPVPSAAFAIETPISCGLPATIAFNNLSEGADGFSWDFADGNRSGLQHPRHEYQNSGDYQITLAVRNQYGCEDNTTENLQVITQPIADFGLDELSGCSPFAATFQNYSDGESFLWNFGDGQSSTERLPTHRYASGGRYDVSLVVGRENKCFDTLLLEGAVEVWTTPTAGFTWADEINGNPSGRILFNNTSENALTYLWDFGDGTQSTEVHPSHRYYVNGIREVYLQALGEMGCTADTLVIIEPEFFGELYVPNAFAPTLGKGEARVFLPKGHGLKEYHLQIFSTYGELIWETFALAEGHPLEGWDGTHQGSPLPQDVYVWKVRAIFEDGTEWKGNKAISGKYQKVGSVTLLR